MFYSVLLKEKYTTYTSLYFKGRRQNKIQQATTTQVLTSLKK